MNTIRKLPCVLVSAIILAMLPISDVNGSIGSKDHEIHFDNPSPFENIDVRGYQEDGFLGFGSSFHDALAWVPSIPRAVPNTTYTVTNTNDSGIGSLRQAITDANNHPGPDIVAFNIPTSDPGYVNNVWVIQPGSLLPSLTGGETTIDGTTQTSNQGDTNIFGPEVQLDGVNLSSTAWLLSVESNDNAIKGLSIIRGGGAGIIIIAGASDNTISGNYIGSDAYGLAASGNGTGIEIFGGAKYNTISDSIISGNILDGIMIAGSGTDSNKIRNNLIGLGIFGIGVIANGRHGISILNGPQSNWIGGEMSYHNTISGNQQHGVYITGSNTKSNFIGNNYIGLNWAGNADLGNGEHGVAVSGGAAGNGIQENVISGNQHHGVYIGGSGTTGNYVRLNIIGADSQGKEPIPNGWHGVAVYDGAQSNWIGTIAPPWGNVIVSSSWSGVAIVNSDQNTVIHNTIGTDENGTATLLGNGYYGVAVEGMDNTIGPDNTIAYNGRDGVRIDGTNNTSLRNTITENSIYSNVNKGIELWANGNQELIVPTISQATCQQVDGVACAGCTVEIFSDSSDEGHKYEGVVTAHATTGAFSWSGTPPWPNVTATATDGQGNTSEFSTPHGVGNCNTAPTAAFTVDPSLGSKKTNFYFNAVHCSDLEDLNSALEVRWDWEDDGTYDTNWDKYKLAYHTYPANGTYTVRLQVRDTGWLTDSTTLPVNVVERIFLPLVMRE
jgi:hypothetical protein